MALDKKCPCEKQDQSSYSNSDSSKEKDNQKSLNMGVDYTETDARKSLFLLMNMIGGVPLS